MTKVLEQLESMNATLLAMAKQKQVTVGSDGEHSPGASVVTGEKEDTGGFAVQQRGGRRKLEIPVFNGDDVRGWLIRVERYFRVNEVKVAEKLNAVVIALEDRALNWFQWWEVQAPLRTWGDFQSAVLRRFDPGSLHNPMGPLLKLRQETTVMAFRDQFEKHATALKPEERTMLTSIFLNGLKDDIQAELKMYDLDDLDELMDKALLIEEKNQALMGKSGVGKDRGETKGIAQNSKFRGSWELSKDHKGANSTNSSNAVKENEKRGDSFKGRRLSQAELEERSKKGLCFKCGDSWRKGHICKMKHMRLMLCEGGDSDEEEELEVSEDIVEELRTLQLSLHSKEGLTTNKSFKVWVIIRGRRVIALIDSGATSSFINARLISELRLEVAETPMYVVEVGTGEQVRNKGVCDNLEFNVQGVEFRQKFFIMELGRTDLVLGMIG